MTGKQRIWTIVWGIVAIFMFYMGCTAWVKRNELARQLAYLQHESRSLNEENESLQNFSRLIGLDSVKEMEVKQRLNLAKPGETLVIFVSPSPIQEATSTSWWQNILKFFRR